MGAKKKIPLNPRRRVSNWKEILHQIKQLRKKGMPLESCCVYTGIAYSTYHAWRKRLEAER